MPNDEEIAELITRLESCQRPDNEVQRRRLWEAARKLSARIEEEHILQHRLLSTVHSSKLISYYLDS